MICQRSTLPVKPPTFLKVGGGVLIDDPAGDDDVVGRARHLHLGMLGQRQIADGGVVDEGQMREVEEVVDHELPVRLDMQIGAFGAPVRIVEPVEVGDLVGIGQRRIAHPDPEPMVALDDRIGPAPGALRNVLLPGNAHAAAVGAKAQARGSGIALRRRPACPSTTADAGARSDPPAQPACPPRCGTTRSARRGSCGRAACGRSPHRLPRRTSNCAGTSAPPSPRRLARVEER